MVSSNTCVLFDNDCIAQSNLMQGIIINYATLDGTNGMNDDAWCLNPYDMFPEVTHMLNLLLLRPPPQRILKRGPSSNVKNQLETFETRMAASVKCAEAKSKRFGFNIPG